MSRLLIVLLSHDTANTIAQTFSNNSSSENYTAVNSNISVARQAGPPTNIGFRYDWRGGLPLWYPSHLGKHRMNKFRSRFQKSQQALRITCKTHLTHFRCFAASEMELSFPLEELTGSIELCPHCRKTSDTKHHS